MKRETRKKKKLRRLERRKQAEQAAAEEKAEQKSRSYLYVGIGLGAAAVIGTASWLYASSGSSDIEVEQPSIVIATAERPLIEASNVERIKTRLSIDDVVKLDGVSEIYSSKGKYPEVIYIGYSHPRRFELAETDEADTREGVEKICFQLFDKYGIPSLIIEGFKGRHVSKYMRGEKLELKKSDVREDTKLLTLSFLKILNGRKWNLYAGDSEELLRKLKEEELPINMIYEAFREGLQEAYSKIYFELGKWEGDKFRPAPVEVIREGTKEIVIDLIDGCNESVDIALTPEQVKKMYSIAVTQRQAGYKGVILGCHKMGKTPVIVVLGETDCITLPDEVGLPYVVVRPEGHQKVPMPTKEYYKEHALEIFRNSYRVPEALRIRFRIPIKKPEFF